MRISFFKNEEYERLTKLIWVETKLALKAGVKKDVWKRDIHLQNMEVLKKQVEELNQANKRKKKGA